MNTILSVSFFITKNMKSELRSGRINGALPILYVFLVRSGYTIRDVTPVSVGSDGALQTGGDAARSGPAPGVKIVFAGSDGEARTLYYFSTNLADDGVKNSNFLKFCETLGPGDGLIKSASYLLHSGGFNRVRDFLLVNDAAMIQDDFGIPLAYYDPQKWDLQPFGRYLGPIGIFPGGTRRNTPSCSRRAGRSISASATATGRASPICCWRSRRRRSRPIRSKRRAPSRRHRWPRTKRQSPRRRPHHETIPARLAVAEFRPVPRTLTPAVN